MPGGSRRVAARRGVTIRRITTLDLERALLPSVCVAHCSRDRMGGFELLRGGRNKHGEGRLWLCFDVPKLNHYCPVLGVHGDKSSVAPDGNVVACTSWPVDGSDRRREPVSPGPNRLGATRFSVPTVFTRRRHVPRRCRAENEACLSFSSSNMLLLPNTGIIQHGRVGSLYSAAECAGPRSSPDMERHGIVRPSSFWVISAWPARSSVVVTAMVRNLGACR